MLDAQDVINIKCKFVHSTIAYIKKLKYFLNTCDSVQDDLVYLMMLDIPNSCMDADISCFLENVSNSVIAPNGNITTSTCTGQTTINLGFAVNSNIYTAEKIAENELYGNPSITLVDNSINQVIKIKSRIYKNGKVVSSKTAAFDGTKYGVNVFLDKPVVNATAYISSIRLYFKDVNNNIYKKDIDTNPLTTPYLTGVNTVLASDLYFNTPGSSVWNYYIQVLENAVNTELGSAAISGEGVYYSSGERKLTTWIKHNPVGAWAGLEPSDIKIVYFNGNTFETILNSNIDYKYINGTWTNNVHTVSTGCGNFVTTFTNSSNSPSNYGSAVFNFNKITGTFGGNVIYTWISGDDFTISGTSNCLSFLANADIITTGTISSVEWKNAANTILSTTNILETNVAGTYTFTVTLTNGCVTSSTINLNFGMPS